ncbi:MAG TPA: hypothetical protein VMW83_15340 [Spirochaetia bacterium]|nr:hypothetical protein [Spirochaetia bacterium]
METKEALEDVQYLKSLVVHARGHVAQMAWYLVVWGAVWLVGFLAQAVGLLSGRHGGDLWAVLVAAGLIATAAVAFRQVRLAGCPMPFLVRLWLWSGLAVFGNGAAVLFLAHVMGFLVVTNPWFWGYFSAVWVGAWYMPGGFLFGRGMTILGAWLVLLGLGIPLTGLGSPAGPAIMGLLGGGALIATGLLARRGGSNV